MAGVKLERGSYFQFFLKLVGAVSALSAKRALINQACPRE